MVIDEIREALDMPQIEAPKVKKFRKAKAAKKTPRNANEPIPLLDPNNYEGQAELSPDEKEDEQVAAEQEFNAPEPNNIELD